MINAKFKNNKKEMFCPTFAHLGKVSYREVEREAQKIETSLLAASQANSSKHFSIGSICKKKNGYWNSKIF